MVVAEPTTELLSLSIPAFRPSGVAVELLKV